MHLGCVSAAEEGSQSGEILKDTWVPLAWPAQSWNVTAQDVIMFLSISGEPRLWDIMVFCLKVKNSVVRSSTLLLLSPLKPLADLSLPWIANKIHFSCGHTIVGQLLFSCRRRLDSAWMRQVVPSLYAQGASCFCSVGVQYRRAAKTSAFWAFSTYREINSLLRLDFNSIPTGKCAVILLHWVPGTNHE